MNRWKRFKIWFRANWQDEKLWRVTYPGGRRTRLLHHHEAWNLQQIFGGELWIDYDAD